MSRRARRFLPNQHGGYSGLEAEYIHNVINHAERYVDGNVHTCNIDNYWALLKRSIKGTYVSVEPFHLFRYLDSRLSGSISGTAKIPTVSTRSRRKSRASVSPMTN
jgi:hypothetical protein